VTRAQIAALIYSMTNGVLFGVGIILVLTLPALSANSGFWISVVVGMSVILALPGNSIHIHSTHVPVEEPLTASIGDIARLV